MTMAGRFPCFPISIKVFVLDFFSTFKLTVVLLHHEVLLPLEQ